MQRALHDHNVFETRIDGLAHDNATAEVRPHVGVLDQEVFDGGTVGLGKKSRIALGVKSVFIVVQALNGVVLTIEHALKRMLLVAKRQMLNGVCNDGFHVVAVELNVVIEINVPAGRIALARQRHTRQKVSLAFDVEFVFVLGHVLGMRRRWQRHNAAQGNRCDGNQPAKHTPVHILDLHRLVRLRPTHNVKYVEGGIACLLVFGLHGLNIDIELE